MNAYVRPVITALVRFALLAAVLFFSACSPYIGYGVVTWSIQDHNLHAGDVVPVYIQSNIGGVYVIGTGPERENRIEVPLWQIDLHKSRSRARKAAAKLEEYRYTYASVKIDGLPVRARPENTARQVYRLRQGEIIRILDKGEGAPVIAGNAPLEGDWFEVLTNDGTTGWCFSYNLTLYDERDEAPVEELVEDDGADPYRGYLVNQVWYPDHYRVMLAENRVDIDRVHPLWGFFPGEESLVARIATAGGVATFEHTGITKTGDRMYRFEGTSLTAEVRRRDALVVQYTDDRGMPQVFYFTTLNKTPEDIIKDEQDRRQEIFDSIRETGPVFSSGSYGVLQFLEGNRFLWSGYQLLTPSVIPSGAGGGGVAELRCFLSESLASRYTGVLTFRFEATGTRVNFLYELTSDGLKLEQVDNGNIKDAVVVSRDLNPTVLFFTPEEPEADGGQ